MLRSLQIEKKASRLSGKVALLVSSGVALNSGLHSSRTSTCKRCATQFLAIGGTHRNCRSIAHVSFALHQFLPVSAKPTPIDPCPDLYAFFNFFSHLTVPLGRAEDDGETGDCAHNTTVGGHLADTCEECAQDYAGCAGGHFVIISIVSWLSVDGIVMIDGHTRQTAGFCFTLELQPNLGLPSRGPSVSQENASIRRWRHRYPKFR